MLRVKHNGSWGTVCDDAFQTVDAQAACYTLGLNGGSFTNYDYDGGTIWMDDVNCATNTTNFLECSHNGWGQENCGSSENVLLTCT